MSARGPAPRRRRRILLGLAAALVLVRLGVALTPARPLLFGVPLGLFLELLVAAASTGVLWFAVRTLLPPAGGLRG